jgi:hypothetical protein
MKKSITYFTLLIIFITTMFMIAYQKDLYVWENPPQNMWIANGKLFDGISEQAIKNQGF